MKLNKIIKCSLAMALVFCVAPILSGCNDESVKNNKDKQYEIYQLAVKSGETSLSYEDWLLSIKGDKGDKGDDGHTPSITIGSNGHWFIDGVDTQVKAVGSAGEAGADGTNWLIGTVAPNNGNGKNGDFYFNTLEQKIFFKENNTWVLKASITDGRDGVDGKQIELNKTDSYIQWRYIGDSTWNNLIALSQFQGEKGDKGQEIELRANDLYIQWKYDDEDSESWRNLVLIENLRGQKGDNGEDGKDGLTPYIGSNGHWFIGERDTGVIATGTNGNNGEAGKDGLTPYIGSNGNWFIGEEDTGVKAAGTDSKQIELNVSGMFVQWRYEGEETWKNLINLNLIKGDKGNAGSEIELRANDLYIQWKYNDEDSTSWRNLILIENLRGQKGDTGETGKDGLTPYIGSNGNWYIGEEDTGVTAAGTNGDNGEDGKDGLTPHIGENGNWFIGEKDTGVKAVGTDGKNGEDGADGKDGVSVVGVTSSADKWGIKITHTFIMSDNTTKESSYYVVDPFRYYAAYNDEDLKTLVSYGASSIRLLSNIDMDTGIVITKGEFVVDLNGYNISITKDKAENGVFLVKDGAKLTIDGEGIVNSVGDNDWSMALWADGGEIVINGGTYTNVGAGGDDHYDLLYAKNGGVITVNNGTFISQTPRWTLNSHNTLIGNIVVKGGKFYNYNPADSKTDDEKYNFVADNYVSIKTIDNEGNYWCEVVEKTNLANVVSFNEGNHVVDQTIFVLGDETDAVVATGTANVTINGGYYDGGVKDGNTAVWAKENATVTINDGYFTVSGREAVSNYNDLIYARDNAHVIINGGFFEGPARDSDGQRFLLNLRDNSNANIEVKGGTFVNFNPADTGTEPNGVSDNFVAEGYTVISEVKANGDIWYTVVSVDALDEIVEINEGTHTINSNIVVMGENTDAVVASGTANLIINGGYYNGGIGDAHTAVWAKENAIVTINDGYFTVSGENAEQGYNDLIYAKDNAYVIINGGFFEGPARDSDGQRFLLNLKDDSNAKIFVYGGTFVNFNPADTGTEPNGVNDNFVGKGYKVVTETKENGDVWYTVVKE